MKRDLRIQKLEELIKTHEPYSFKELTYKMKRGKLEVYEIPVEYLIFNQHNGRIGTYVKTYEKQYGIINASTDEGERIIIDFLWSSKEKRNKETQKDIEINGQMEYGIVTKDGIVIDGNRRCMLLKKIAKEKHDSPTYFKAVILDDTFEGESKEIRKLETTYQMGVDEKVDYNAIEKYLACKDLSLDFTNEEIAKMMGDTPSDIAEYLEILALMEDYLKRLGYQGMYTRLNTDKVEGPFVDLKRYIATQKSGKGIRGRDWIPQKEDIGELKNLYFDYIRAGFRTAHGIRDIGNPSKGHGFFTQKKIWKDFCEQHNRDVDISEDNLKEWRRKRPDEDVESIIDARDADWRGKVKNTMLKNYGITKRRLDDNNQADLPMELLTRAMNTLKAINTEEDTFDEQVLEIIKEINSLAWDFQQIIKRKLK